MLRQEATDQLKDMVSQFNDRLKLWDVHYGCNVDFSWTYDAAGKKRLEIAAIDCPIYRRGNTIDGQTLEQALAKYSDPPPMESHDKTIAEIIADYSGGKTPGQIAAEAMEAEKDEKA